MRNTSRNTAPGPFDGRSGTAVSRAKLRPPDVTSGYLRRQRLLDLLDDSVTVPLTLVVSPPGSGKTALLASWVAEGRCATAWFSLDEADRDPVQLWAGIIAALETISPGCGSRALAQLRRPEERPDAVRTLLDDLEGSASERSVLVIEDIHLVDEDPANAAALAAFVQGLPHWLHLVLSSRRAAHLPIDRLRVRGLLREVHFAELRFSEPEAEEMLSKIVPGMPVEDAGAAARRAGGWAASIQLAALGWREGAAQPESPMADPQDQLMLTDYLWHEMLVGEDPEVVDTLLDISIVERTNADLAIALTGRQDAARLLAGAEARGQFVSRLSAPGWYSLHGLIRDLLVADLRSRNPDRLDQLHARAAAWYVDHNEVPLALAHWLRSGRPREALRLLAARSMALYDSGREAVVSRTLEQIPMQTASSDLQAMTDYAWCHLLLDRRRFLALVYQLSAATEESSDPGDIEPLRIRILASIASVMRGDWDTGGRQARQALADLGPGWRQDGLGRYGWNVVAREIALNERWEDGAREVREVMELLVLDPERRIAFEGTRALGHALAGRPIDALRIGAGIRGAAETSNMAILRSELKVAEALAHREIGDRQRGVELLNELIERPGDAADYTKLLAALELTQVALDDGDLDRAQSRFDEAEEFIQAGLDGAGTRDWLARTGNVLALACGDTRRADDWAEEITDPLWTRLATARVRLASGDRDGATALLEQVTPRCVRHVVIRNLLLARAADSSEQAQKHLIAAIEPAAANGILQTVASEGHETVALVEQAAWRVPDPWLARLRRAATPDLRPSAVDVPQLIEALTEREREVLRLLPSRLTLREVADELYISMNTLKFHLKVIYRKLGCSSRAEAAEMARAQSRIKWADQSSRTRRF